MKGPSRSHPPPRPWWNWSRSFRARPSRAPSWSSGNFRRSSSMRKRRWRRRSIKGRPWSGPHPRPDPHHPRVRCAEIVHSTTHRAPQPAGQPQGGRRRLPVPPDLCHEEGTRRHSKKTLFNRREFFLFQKY